MRTGPWLRQTALPPPAVARAALPPPPRRMHALPCLTVGLTDRSRYPKTRHVEAASHSRPPAVAMPPAPRRCRRLPAAAPAAHIIAPPAIPSRRSRAPCPAYRLLLPGHQAGRAGAGAGGARRGAPRRGAGPHDNHAAAVGGAARGAGAARRGAVGGQLQQWQQREGCRVSRQQASGGMPAHLRCRHPCPTLPSSQARMLALTSLNLQRSTGGASPAVLALRTDPVRPHSPAGSSSCQLPSCGPPAPVGMHLSWGAQCEQSLRHSVVSSGTCFSLRCGWAWGRQPARITPASEPGGRGLQWQQRLACTRYASCCLPPPPQPHTMNICRGKRSPSAHMSRVGAATGVYWAL